MTVITARYTFSGVGEDFGPRADGIVTLHTTEPTDPLKTTVRDGLALARWQDADSVAGSYNRLICTDGVVSTVPDDHASGGINPSSSGFRPRAWLYDVLDADEVRNPNYFTLNLAAMGRKAHFNTYGWPTRIIDGFARSIIEEEQRIGRNVVVTQHADFQPPPNRSDAGDIAIALVKLRYAELTEDVMPLAYKPELWRSKGTPLASGTIPAGTIVFTVGESEDGRKRLAVVGDPERLEWVDRWTMDPLVRGGDPELRDAIAQVVSLRLEGKPVSFGDAVALAELRDRVSALSEWQARVKQVVGA